MIARSPPPMIRIDWKPIILWGGGIGALIGSWWGLWISGFLLAWDHGWLHPGIKIPAEYVDLLQIPIEDSLGWVARILGLRPGSGLTSLLLWMTGIGAAAGAGAASIGRLLRLDPGMTAMRSFAWSLRAVTTPMAVAISLSVVALAGVAFALESILADGWLSSVLLGVLVLVGLIVLFLIIPIVVCREDIVGRSRAPRWWHLRWPCWMPVLIFLGIEALNYVPDWLLSLVDADSGAPPRIVATAGVVDVAIDILLFVGPLVQCVVLLKIGGSLIDLWRGFFRWPALGPWLALHGWWTVLALFFAPPIAAVYVWLWKVVPVLATIHESVLDESLPYVYQLFINACNFVGNFWWIILPAPLLLFFWLGTARFVVLSREQSAAGSPENLRSHPTATP